MGQICPWCATGMDDSLPLDRVRAGRMPTKEGVGQERKCKTKTSGGLLRSTATKVVVTRSSQGAEEVRPPVRSNADAWPMRVYAFWPFRRKRRCCSGRR